jgi:hypothetical protein
VANGRSLTPGTQEPTSLHGETDLASVRAGFVGEGEARRRIVTESRTAFRELYSRRQNQLACRTHRATSQDNAPQHFPKGLNSINVSPMEISQNTAASIVSWMLHEGRFNTRMRQFGHELCERILAAGIPIVRSFCYVGTLHPQIAASAYIWKRSEAQSNRISRAHGLEERPDFMQSPLMIARRTDS